MNPSETVECLHKLAKTVKIKREYLPVILKTLYKTSQYLYEYP